MSENENGLSPDSVTLPNGTRNGTCKKITWKAIKTRIAGLYSQGFIFSSFGIKIVPDKLIGGGITTRLGTAVSELLFSLNRLGTLVLMM